MTNEIKTYLNNIVNKKDYFIFYKFYLKPESFLSTNNNKMPNELQHFLHNNNFLEFLNLCLNDIHFISKLNDINLKNIRLFLIFQRKKRKYLKEKRTPKINVSLINNLIEKITELETKYYFEYIQFALERKDVLSRIITDDYEIEKECFLKDKNGFDTIIFKHLVCDNEFLEIINKYLLEKNISYDIINNLIDIINLSLIFKNHMEDSIGLDYYYKLLDEGKRKKYDNNLAAKTLNELIKKRRNCKLINILSIKKRNNW